MATCHRQPFASPIPDQGAKGDSIERVHRTWTRTYARQGSVLSACFSLDIRREAQPGMVSKSEMRRERQKTDATIVLATSSGAFRTRGIDRQADSESQIVCVSSLPSARTA